MFDWRKFLSISSEHLRRTHRSTLSEWSKPGGGEPVLRSWCSWTTFSRLRNGAGYWTNELPLEEELGEKSVADGGTWGQPFPYDDIAHVILPREFYEEQLFASVFHMWTHDQDIDGLSERLNAEGIGHRLTDLVLEVKLY